MKKRLLALIGSLTLLLALSACSAELVTNTSAETGTNSGSTSGETGAQANTEANGKVTSIADLITELKAQGIQVETQGQGSSSIQLPSLELNGDLLTSGDSQVNAFEFPTSEEAQAELQTLLNEGESALNMTADDLSNLKIYNDENVVVVYTGSNADLEAQLEALFGPADSLSQ
jgi:hypothetical protein